MLLASVSIHFPLQVEGCRHPCISTPPPPPTRVCGTEVTMKLDKFPKDNLVLIVAKYIATVMRGRKSWINMHVIIVR